MLNLFCTGLIIQHEFICVSLVGMSLNGMVVLIDQNNGGCVRVSMFELICECLSRQGQFRSCSTLFFTCNQRY